MLRLRRQDTALPRAIASGVRRKLRATPPRRLVRRLSLGVRTVPASTQYGYDRGTPVDRYYIEAFLSRFSGAHGYAAGSLRGTVLEIGGRDYVDAFGVFDGSEMSVQHVDVLHADASNPSATIVGDVTQSDTLALSTYDCVVCTQVLPVIWDVPAALRSLHDALKPGGILLVTVPGISKALTPDRDHWGDWWRFTSSSMHRLASDAFPGGTVHVESYGSVLSATAFLHGYSAEELSRSELDLRDPEYEVLIGLRAIKAWDSTPRSP